MRAKNRNAKPKPKHVSSPKHIQDKGNRDDGNGEAVAEKSNEQHHHVSPRADWHAKKGGASVIREVFCDKSLDNHCPERMLCIVCNRRGAMLICSGSGCPFAFHENCLRVEPCYDETGNFSCPFCWCKWKIAQKEKSRERVLLAEKNLLQFLNWKVPDDDNQKEEAVGETRIGDSSMSRFMDEKDANHGQVETNSHNVQTQFGHVAEGVKADAGQANSREKDESFVKQHQEDISTAAEEATCNASHSEVYRAAEDRENCGIEDKENEMNEQYVEKPIEREENENHESGDKENEMDGEVVGDTENEKDGEAVGDKENEMAEEAAELPIEKEENKNHDSRDKENEIDEQGVELSTEKEEKHHSVECDSISDDSVTDKETLSVRITRSRERVLNAKKARNVKSPRRSYAQPKVTAGENVKDQSKKSVRSKRLKPAEEVVSKNQNENKVARKKPKLLQRSPKQSSSTTIPGGRRKKLVWRPEEEEMLKEGVEKYSTAVNKNIPWRKILEFGHHVFDSSRTPADLKDKWRNILSKESPRNGRSSH